MATLLTILLVWFVVSVITGLILGRFLAQASIAERQPANPKPVKRNTIPQSDGTVPARH